MILDKIKRVDFPKDQYYQTEYEKRQIVLHHTVSGRGVKGDINWWAKGDKRRIATCIIIGWEGVPYQLFSSRFYGAHLGIKAKVFKENGIPYTWEKDGEKSRISNNRNLDRHSIGIEIDSWGALIEHEGKWHPWRWDSNLKKAVPRSTIVPKERVQIYPDGFKGFYGYEKYTDEQIRTCEELLVFWNRRYKIPLKYSIGIWVVNKNALSGDRGVYTHVSYRKDKSDCHPQPELIQMLKSL